MNVDGLWRASEMTSKICNVIVYLKGEQNYSRADAAKDLENFLIEHMEPIIATEFINSPESSANENLAIEEEIRLKQLEEKREENEG